MNVDYDYVVIVIIIQNKVSFSLKDVQAVAVIKTNCVYHTLSQEV